MVIQRSYPINPDFGFPGRIAEPNAPTRIEVGIGVADFGGGRAHPIPGDPAARTSTGFWASPNDANAVRNSIGIFTFDADEVANADNFVTYVVGGNTKVYVVTRGVVWLRAGNTIERGEQVIFNTGGAELNWHSNTTRQTALGNLHRYPVFSVDVRTVGDGDVFKAAIGYGRTLII